MLKPDVCQALLELFGELCQIQTFVAKIPTLYFTPPPVSVLPEGHAAVEKSQLELFATVWEAVRVLHGIMTLFARLLDEL